jgi:hypothetical protein
MSYIRFRYKDDCITGQISNSGPDPCLFFQDRVCPVNMYNFCLWFHQNVMNCEGIYYLKSVGLPRIVFRLQEVGLSLTWTVSTMTKISSKCRQLVKLFLGL